VPRNTLAEVQRLVDELSPLEQVRLLEYLAPRIGRAVASMAALESGSEQAATWAQFFRIGDRLASGDRPGSETLTAALLAMRR
jgi:hypothetical protein